MKPGELFLTTTSWDAIHMRKNPHGIWVPKQREDNRFLISLYAMLVYSTLPPNTPAMYIGSARTLKHVGVFLVADIFYELPYNILKQIEEVNNDNS